MEFPGISLSPKHIVEFINLYFLPFSSISLHNPHSFPFLINIVVSHIELQTPSGFNKNFPVSQEGEEELTHLLPSVSKTKIVFVGHSSKQLSLLSLSGIIHILYADSFVMANIEIFE